MACRAHHQLCAFGTRLTARQGGSHAIGLRPAADARLASDSRPADRPYAAPTKKNDIGSAAAGLQPRLPATLAIVEKVTRAACAANASFLVTINIA